MSNHPLRTSTTLLLVVALCVTFVACTATRGLRGKPAPSGFLGDYSQLEKNPEYPAAEVYVNPDADWMSYSAIILDSVTLWVKGQEGTRLTPEEKQMLTDTLYRALHDQLSAQFQLAERPQPGALRMRVALTQVKGANVPLRTVTTVIPQLRILAAAAALSTNVAYTVGTATIEGEILDAITHRRLAAAVDSRAGNKALFSMRTFQKWADVEAAANLWAARFTWQLVKHGVQRKPGAPELPEPSEKRRF